LGARIGELEIKLGDYLGLEISWLRKWEGKNPFPEPMEPGIGYGGCPERAIKFLNNTLFKTFPGYLPLNSR